jgi:hypothetical protein
MECLAKSLKGYTISSLVFKAKKRKISSDGCTKFLDERQRFLNPERFLDEDRCGADAPLVFR